MTIFCRLQLRPVGHHQAAKMGQVIQMQIRKALEMVVIVHLHASGQSVDETVEGVDFFQKLLEKRRQFEVGIVFVTFATNFLKVAINAFRIDPFDDGDGLNDMASDRFQGGKIVRRSRFGAVEPVHHGTDAVEKRLADVVINVEKFIVAWHGTPG